jgi:hypothetical protein
MLQGRDLDIEVLIRGADTGVADGGDWASVSRLDLDPDTVASQKSIVNPITNKSLISITIALF